MHQRNLGTGTSQRHGAGRPGVDRICKIRLSFSLIDRGVCRCINHQIGRMLVHVGKHRVWLGEVDLGLIKKDGFVQWPQQFGQRSP